MRTAARRAGWRKSTYSDHSDHCVEVDFTGTGVEIRHSKTAQSPVISFTVEQWSRWLDEVVADELTNTNGAVDVSVVPDAWIVRSLATGTTLVFTAQEWTAFRLGAADGEFAPPLAAV